MPKHLREPYYCLDHPSCRAWWIAHRLEFKTYWEDVPFIGTIAFPPLPGKHSKKA